MEAAVDRRARRDGTDRRRGRRRQVAARRPSSRTGSRNRRSSLVGQCFDLVDRALPFGPIVQVLRTLHRTLDDATLDAVARPGARRARGSAPELHDTPRAKASSRARCSSSCSACSSASPSGSRRCSCSRTCTGPTARPASCSCISARSLRTASMVLVGTYRSDDLHRRHPLRILLAELDRSGAVERIELERFDLDEVRELVAAIVGARAVGRARRPHVPPLRRQRVLRRGTARGGRRAAASRCRPRCARSCSRASTGSRSRAQQVLRCAAVIGRSADHRLLEATAGISAADVLARRCARPSRNKSWSPTATALEYRFRHALVREAVEDDLLPGDRVALHTAGRRDARRASRLVRRRRRAAARGRAGVPLGRGARRARALAARARRGPGGRARSTRTARRSSTPSTSLTLWPQVPDAETRAPACATSTSCATPRTQAEMSGSTDRALDYITRRGRRSRAGRPIRCSPASCTNGAAATSGSLGSRGRRSWSTATRRCASCRKSRARRGPRCSPPSASS